MSAHRIDVHHHILPPDYVRIVGHDRIGPLILAGKTPEWTPAHSIAAMDRNGIETAVTSISAPGVWFGESDTTNKLTRHCNEYAAELRRDHPGRFGMFASLPLPNIETSLSEIEYSLDTLKADGIGLMTNCDGKYPGDAAFAPVFDELNRRKAIVYFHPTSAPCSNCLSEIPAATLDFPFDTTRAVTSLLFGGTLARCPDIRFIFSHAGGTVPFLADRIARLVVKPDFKAKVPNGVIPELQKLYYDTALSANPRSFAALLALVAPSQILFGSDYPFAPEPTMTQTIDGLSKLGLGPEVLRQIERDNALALLGEIGNR